MRTIEIDNLWNNFTYNDDTKSYYYDGAKQLANLIVDTSNKDYTKYERTFSCGYLCLLTNSKTSKMPSLVIFKPKTKCKSSNAVNFWDSKLTHKKQAKSIFNENTVFISSQMLFGSIVNTTDIKDYITSNSDIQNADTIADTIFNSEYHGLEYIHKIKHTGYKKYIFSKRFSSIDAAKAASTSYKDYDGIFSMSTSPSSSRPVTYIKQPRNYINNINFVTYQKHSIDIHEHIKYKPLKCISAIQNENSACKIITSCTCAYYNDNTSNSGGIALYFTQKNQRSIKYITNVLGNQFCLLFGYNNDDKFDLGFKSAHTDQHNRIIASTFTNDNVIFAHINNQIATLVSSNANTRLIDDLPITDKSQYYTHDIHLFTSTFNSNCSYISSNINTYKVKIDSKIFKPLYILANDIDMDNWSDRKSRFCQNIIWSTAYYNLSMRNHEKYEFISGNIAVEK